MKTREGCGRRGRSSRGRKHALVAMTMVELALVMSILAVAFLALSQSLVGAVSLNRVNRETALATDGLREQVERMEGVEDFSAVFSLYNSDPGDDPVGGAPGPTFDVRGLDPVDGSLAVGEVFFPTLDAGGGVQELREDVVDPELGMPRDLNGDGKPDGLDHSDDYRLLPVLLRLRWKGPSGEREAVLRTLLADR